MGRGNVAEHGAIGVENRALVVGDQDAVDGACRDHHAATPRAWEAVGRSTWIRAPLPGPSLSAYMRPAMAATLLADQCSPRPPVLSRFVLKPRSNTLVRLALSMPIPSSLTVMRTMGRSPPLSSTPSIVIRPVPRPVSAIASAEFMM